ncbi:MAG: hypothetical protein K0R71_1214 [Bacillales bacterium]|jgi:DNA polymerase III epsilon subunit family exonuclease|nr:hypothetical protein [Bacillales bacterium]
MSNFLVIDVETPNSRNDSLCSIGIVKVKNYEIESDFYMLINPECHFDARNIRIHGITPEVVTDKTIFRELWEKIEGEFYENIVVGHNMSFDLSVIKKALCGYGIKPKNIKYLCTYNLAKKYVTEIENHRLNTLCDYFDINLNKHHNAAEDSIACAKLLQKLIQRYNINLEEHLNEYSFHMENTGSKMVTERQSSQDTRKLQELEGIVTGLVADSELNEKEVLFLNWWLEENRSLKGNYPFDRIYDSITEVLRDGYISKDELNELLNILCDAFTPVECSVNVNEIDFYGKLVCLSGEFEYGEKSKVERLLETRGAVISKSVNKKINYVIVGSKGSEQWTNGNYGSKVKKTLEYQAKGIAIEVISELHISDLLK